MANHLAMTLARFESECRATYRALFNVASSFLMSLAHMRRHVAQAAGVRSRPDFPN